VKKHKNIVIFLIKFFVTYFTLVVIYTQYLGASQQKEAYFKTSSITTLVANQTKEVLVFMGYQVQAIQHQDEMSVKILFEGHYVAKIIEGCNSLSLIILFLSFIIAFKGSIKDTILYGLVGSALIYVINVLRIALLVWLLYTYPAQNQLLHNVVFPAIIYGTIFILWILWVRHYSTYKR